jgi:hypothetical protein
MKKSQRVKLSVREQKLMATKIMWFCRAKSVPRFVNFCLITAAPVLAWMRESSPFERYMRAGWRMYLTWADDKHCVVFTMPPYMRMGHAKRWSDMPLYDRFRELHWQMPGDAYRGKG